MGEQLTPEVIDQTPDVTPADVVDAEAFLQELAALSRLDYDRRRDSAAKLLGVRVGTLDAAVATRLPRDAQAEGQGTSVVFADPIRGNILLAGVRFGALSTPMNSLPRGAKSWQLVGTQGRRRG